MYCRGFRLLLALSLAHVGIRVVQAQPQAAETRAEHYMRHARLVAAVPLTFPGPEGGVTMAHFPVREVTKYGDTIIETHAFMLDLGTANEGDYLPTDSSKSAVGYTPWDFRFPNGRIVHTELAPSSAHPEYRKLDSTYMGTLGYAFFKQFVSVLDFRKNTFSLYTLFSSVDIADRDTMGLQIPIVDDAVLTYCHCHYPTIWLEAEAPPLKAGHVHIALESPRSAVYEPSLDAKTRKRLARESVADSLTGKKPSVGLALAQFTVQGENLAWRNPHRWVEPLPAVFKDLSVSVMGSVGTDFLRTFSALIIDPSRTKLIFVK